MFEGIIKRGTLMTVIILIVSVLGVMAALRIPVQMIPDLEVRTITVRTSWPGATPQDIEKEIVIEPEEYLRSIPGLQRIISSSSFGRASIELEFPYGIDLNETLINVNNALSQVPSYPVNVDEPRIYATSFSSNSFMYFRVAPLEGNPKQLNMILMQDFIEAVTVEDPGQAVLLCQRLDLLGAEEGVEAEDRVGPVLELRALEALGVVEHDLAHLERALLGHREQANREKVHRGREVGQHRGLLHRVADAVLDHGPQAAAIEGVLDLLGPQLQSVSDDPGTERGAGRENLSRGSPPLL